MRIIVILIAAISIYQTSNSQNLILNGSFENNTATGNTLNLTSAWPSVVSNSFEVDGGSMDLITSNNCGMASNGNWYTTCSQQGGIWPYLAFSFKLSSKLVLGTYYTLTFDKRYCGPNTSAIDIGISNDSTLMGTPVHTFPAPQSNTWSQETHIFQASLAAQYLTVNVGVTGSTGTVGLDNFILQTGAVGVSEFDPKNFKLFFDGSRRILAISSLNTFYAGEIEVFNDLGARVFSSGLKQQITNEINLANLPKGIYFVKIYFGERFFSEKILIQ